MVVIERRIPCFARHLRGGFEAVGAGAVVVLIMSRLLVVVDSQVCSCPPRYMCWREMGARQGKARCPVPRGLNYAGAGTERGDCYWV